MDKVEVTTHAESQWMLYLSFLISDIIVWLCLKFECHFQKLCRPRAGVGICHDSNFYESKSLRVLQNHRRAQFVIDKFEGRLIVWPFFVCVCVSFNIFPPFLRFHCAHGRRVEVCQELFPFNLPYVESSESTAITLVRFLHAAFHCPTQSPSFQSSGD